MTEDIRTYDEVIKAYKHIKSTRDNFGFPRKSIFHVHTPASHDYRFIDSLGTNGYKKISEKEKTKKLKILLTGFIKYLLFTYIVYF